MRPDHTGVGSVSANVVSNPPTPLDCDLARRQIEALDGLPRPTLVDEAPFVQSDELRAWVSDGLEQLS